MSDPFNSYLGLSTAQRTQPEALARLFQALSRGQEPTTEQRRKLLGSLLSSAASLSDSHSSDSNYVLLLASTLKFLGRSPAGSEELARDNGIRTLLELGGIRRLAELPRPKFAGSQGKTEDDDDDPEAAANRSLEQREEDQLRPAEAEALRCLCNVLMLHPSARDVFPNVILFDDRRTAMKAMTRILGCEGAGFLGGRLLFMLTSKPSEAVVELVLEEDVVKTLSEFANRYLIISNSQVHRSRLTTGPMPKPEDVLREHLKLAYTLMLQFGRSGNASRRGSRADSIEKKRRRFWPSKQSSTTETTQQPEEDINEDSSVIQVERRDSATRSHTPLAIAKRVVGAVRSNTPASGSSTSVTPMPRSSSPTGSSSRRSSTIPAQEGTSPDSLSLAAAQPFLPIFRPYLALAISSPLYLAGTSPKEVNPTVRSAFNALLNFPVELEELDGSDFSWIQYLPPRSDHEGVLLRAGGIGSLGERLIELLQTTCDTFFPVDSLPPKSSIVSSTETDKPRVMPANPDDWITTGEGEATKIEELLGPVMLLMRKLSMIGEAHEMFRFVLFPPDLDRTKPINRHPTLTGHLVRLLSSVFLPNTAFGVGEFLYNLAERSPEQLCALIGYGSASGFLQNRGELIPPPPLAVDEDAETSPRSTSRPIDPITGAFEEPEDPNHVAMTEEEKEQEAEKLYTLFNRMERTGIMSTENPVNKARQEGKFQETKEEREAELERLRKEEEEVERQVEKEMAEWKAKRGRTTE